MTRAEEVIREKLQELESLKLSMRTPSTDGMSVDDLIGWLRREWLDQWNEERYWEEDRYAD